MKRKMFFAFCVAILGLLAVGCPSPITSDPVDNDYTSDIIGTLKYVPAGSFQRDGISTNISVITQPFRMSQHEITRDQFLLVMGVDPSDTNLSSGTTDPVQKVNWYHAITFCNKLSIADGLTPVYAVIEDDGFPINWPSLEYHDIPTSDNTEWNEVTATWSNNGYRLPTEMEWMWAAMGAPADGQGDTPNTTGYLKAFAGSTENNLIDNYAWSDRNSGDTTHPVGTRVANELGLYDLSGNVFEFCWDWSGNDPDLAKVEDYRGPASGDGRVLRGGSYYFNMTFCRVAFRGEISTPYWQDITYGIRVVRR